MFPCSSRGARATMVAALALAVAPAGALAQSTTAPLVGTAQPNQIPGQYIVVLKSGRGAANADRLERRARDRGSRVQRQYRRALNGFSAQLTDSALADVRNDPDVAFVEADAVVTASATQTQPPWGLDRIDQANLPLSTTYTYNATGAGVNAYVIDTGIRTSHAQFGGRATSGYDAIDNQLPAADCNGHGTHVAGTVGGSTYGVAKGVNLIAVRVLDCNGSGSTSGVIAGINWVTTHHQANTPAVANMSLGGGASSSLDTAVRNSIADGVTYAIAAGNDNTNACNQSPGRTAEALTVGSTTSSDARSSFSNYGTCVDLFAPGSSILSAWHTSDTATNTISGTSMATPHVAGVAALYLQGAPTALPAAVNAAIVNGATPNKVTNPGSGSPNRLLYSLLGGTVPPPLPDTTPPDTTIASGPAEGSTTNDATPTFGYTSSETGSTFECQDDSGAWAACASPSDRGPFGNGSHTFRVRAKDAAGNVDPTPAQRTFTVSVTTPTGCGLAQGFSGTLSGTGAAVLLPTSNGYTTTRSGTHRACLTGPASADFDLELYKRSSSGSSWSRVARSVSASSTESISYSGTAGTYRVRVFSYRGSGAYQAGITAP